MEQWNQNGHRKPPLLKNKRRKKDSPWVLLRVVILLFIFLAMSVLDI